MKTFRKKCPMCGEEIIWFDIRNEPVTCGRRECESNYEYRRKHTDPITGEQPSAEKVRNW